LVLCSQITHNFQNSTFSSFVGPSFIHISGTHAIVFP
jgi:hypothetical protein